jgi:hypothetical protein
MVVDNQSMAVCSPVMAVPNCHKGPSSGKPATKVMFAKVMLVLLGMASKLVSVAGHAMAGICKLFFASCFTQALPTH